MKFKNLIFGERSLTKLAALFGSKTVAEDVAQQVKDTAGLDDPQVYLLGPQDGTASSSPAFSRKLEPEQAGIWRTLIRAHVITGTAGVIAGLLVYFGFQLADNAAVQSTPGMSLVAMAHLFITLTRRDLGKKRFSITMDDAFEGSLSAKLLEKSGTRHTQRAASHLVTGADPISGRLV